MWCHLRHGKLPWFTGGVYYMNGRFFLRWYFWFTRTSSCCSLPQFWKCIPNTGVLRPSTHKGGDLFAPGGTNQQYLGLEKSWVTVTATVVWQCIIFIYIMLDADESWDFQLSWLLTWEDGNGTSRDWHFPKGEDLLQIFAGCWVVMRGVAPIIWDSRTFEDPDNRPYFWNIYI